MNHQSFDTVARAVAGSGSRRDALYRLASLGLGLGVSWRPVITGARKKRKKDKKPQPNAYGCLDVGQSCQGDSSQCCSGLCEGTKPKKGKPDKIHCVAHDAAICRGPDTDTCTTGVAHYCNGSNLQCGCLLTTGNAGFCGGPDPTCRVCSRDVDCQEEFGPGAACVVLGGICDALCPDTGGTACAVACPGAVEG